MASGTIRRELRRRVVGIGGLVEVGRMAACAGVGRVGVVAVVAGRAIIGHCCVCAQEWII